MKIIPAYILGWGIGKFFKYLNNPELENHSTDWLIVVILAFIATVIAITKESKERQA